MNIHKLLPVIHTIYGRCVVASIYDPALHNNIPLWIETDVENGNYPNIPMFWSEPDDVQPMPIEEDLKIGEVVTSCKKSGKFAVLTPPAVDSLQEYGTTVELVSLSADEGFGYLIVGMLHELTRDEITADELIDFQEVVHRYHSQNIQPVASYVTPGQVRVLLNCLVRSFRS